MRSRRVLVLLGLALLLAIGWSSVAAADTNILYILDLSGSMWGQVDGVAKIETARKVLIDTLNDLPPDTRAGLMVYGHRSKKDCGDIELIHPIGPPDLTAMTRTITTLKPKGMTPLAESLRRAITAFADFKGQNNNVLLVSDGIESCNADPCEAAAAAHEAGLNIAVHVVAFDLKQKEQEQIRCIADRGGGQFFTANSVEGLRNALTAATTVAVQTPPQLPPKPARPNLLSVQEGGQLVAAPNDLWLGFNDGAEKPFTWLRAGDEGVFAFRDDRPATFDLFTVLVQEATPNNLAEFELLAGDEGPTGPFRSIGTFKTQNAKLLKTPYQEFKFPPVTARYLKVKLLSNFGGDGYIAGTEFQLFGQLAEATAAAAPASGPAQGQVNLLDPAQGGSLLVAPNDLWAQLNDDKGNSFTWLQAGQEGVYGFKNDRPASFDSFAVLVNETTPNNMKEFELLAGDEGPTGSFRSIGTFTIQNVKLLKNPYQAFKFPAVTARYLKVKLLSNYGGDGYIAGTEFQLYGQLAEATGASQPVVPATGSDEVNLLDPAQGGSLLVAPNDLWSQLNDGKENSFTWLRAEEEGVFGFKDDKPATFDSFSVFVNETTPNNLKDFELLVGDEGPTGSFRSIGTFTTQNVKLLKSPYQEFKFPPATARYLKVKLLSNYGGDGYIAGTEFRLLGRIAEGAATTTAPTALATASTATTAAPANEAAGELLSTSHGGQLLVAPSDLWQQYNDGKEDSFSWLHAGEEAVYAFQDEKPARLERFAILIPGTDPGNVKDFELLVGDEGPTSSFRSIGTFTTQNARLVKSPYQEFIFEPVEARYLKVKLLSNFGGDGYIRGTEIRAYGTLEP
ncbi:MAG: VWA domain-containing protein [Pseudomonadota bacterium]